MVPSLLLKDGRKLVYRPGVARRHLRGLKAPDVSAVGDASTLKSIPETDNDEEPATSVFPHHGPDVDFDYEDRNLRVVVDLKIRTSEPSNRSIEEWINRIRHFAGENREYNRAELWLVSRNASELTIWSLEAGRPKSNSYGLDEVILSDKSPRFYPKQRALIDSEYIELRVRIWQRQVSSLFDDVAAWASEAGYKADKTGKVWMDEEEMQRFGVNAVDLPVLKISSGGKVIATAFPVGLWVIGAHGRVDILTSRASTSVINTSRDLDAPNWQTYVGDQPSKRFDRDFFLNFIGANERT